VTLPTDAIQQKPQIKHLAVDRRQLCFGPWDLGHLIEEGHPAGIIWEMVERVDVSKFEQEAASWEGDGGRPRWPPRVLLSVLVYGYSLGVASARELECCKPTNRACAGCAPIRPSITLNGRGGFSQAHQRGGLAVARASGSRRRHSWRRSGKAGRLAPNPALKRRAESIPPYVGRDSSRSGLQTRMLMDSQAP
jgi:hypothetical protein